MQNAFETLPETFRKLQFGCSKEIAIDSKPEKGGVLHVVP